MGCDCENALIAIQVMSDVEKKLSSQVVSMKDLIVVYDATVLLKIIIIDMMNCNKLILKTDGEAVLHHNQCEIQKKKRSNESLLKKSPVRETNQML